jgi:hypothetical protein
VSAFTAKGIWLRSRWRRMGLRWRARSDPGPNPSEIAAPHEITAEELLSDRAANNVARMALIQHMTDEQIHGVIRQLEQVATQRGDRVGDSVQARAALILHASVSAKRKRGSAWPSPGA